MVVVGIDPGLGVKSPTGFAAIDTSNGEIFHVANIWPKKSEKELHNRIVNLSNSMRHELRVTAPDLVSFEAFVMRGKSGVSLQRLIGAYFGALPTKEKELDVIEVQNVQIKQFVGGDGGSDKEAVAEGVYDWFVGKNQRSADQVRALIKEEHWDILDALAIAISGYLIYTTNPPPKKRKRKK